MKLGHFLNRVEHDRVTAAIRAAEEGTSSDIVLYISHRAAKNPLAAATRAFTHLHLGQSKNHNSLLIFLAPTTQNFAVVGGAALHQKMGQAWWNELSAILAVHFKEERYTDGLLAALAEAGTALKKHFPAVSMDRTGQVDIVEE